MMMMKVEGDIIVASPFKPLSFKLHCCFKNEEEEENDEEINPATHSNEEPFKLSFSVLPYYCR